MKETDGIDIDDGSESSGESLEFRRHSRDPTYAVGEDDFKETGYMIEGASAKSYVGIKHSRNASVLLHSDAQRLLHLCRGKGTNGCHSDPLLPQEDLDVDGSYDASSLRREYVEDAALIHEAVFYELQRTFPDMLQLQRLLLLDGVMAWNGWSEIKALLSSSISDDVKQIHVRDFVYRFVRRCQTDCIYDDCPSDTERLLA